VTLAKVVSTRLDVEVDAQIRARAADHGNTVAGELRRAVRLSLDGGIRPPADPPSNPRQRGAVHAKGGELGVLRGLPKRAVLERAVAATGVAELAEGESVNQLIETLTYSRVSRLLNWLEDELVVAEREHLAASTASP